MKQSKFSETEIVSILKQGDAGMAVNDLCRKANADGPAGLMPAEASGDRAVQARQLAPSDARIP